MADDDTEAVVGYFALAPHLFERDELPKRIGRGAVKKLSSVASALELPWP